MKSAFLSASIGLLLSVCVSAEVIIDNIGGIRSSTGTQESFFPEPAPEHFIEAQSFVIPDGHIYRLTSVTIPFTYYGNGSNSVAISIWDSHPLPYPNLYAGSPAPNQPIATLGSTVFTGRPAYWSYETFTNFGNLTLPAGLYWVVVQQSQPQLNSINWWRFGLQGNHNYSPTGTGGLLAFATGVSTNNNSWSLSGPKTAAALAIEGELTGPIEPGPKLSLNVEGSNFIISWPNWAGGHRLESSTSLGATAQWSQVTEQVPVYINERWIVTNSISSSPRFFRLSIQQ